MSILTRNKKLLLGLNLVLFSAQAGLSDADPRLLLFGGQVAFAAGSAQDYLDSENDTALKNWVQQAKLGDLQKPIKWKDSKGTQTESTLLIWAIVYEKSDLLSNYY